ncbi:MAG: hypothetical protein AB1776_07320 [Bacillota bacterium]
MRSEKWEVKKKGRMRGEKWEMYAGQKITVNTGMGNQGKEACR